MEDCGVIFIRYTSNHCLAVLARNRIYYKRNELGESWSTFPNSEERLDHFKMAIKIRDIDSGSSLLLYVCARLFKKWELNSFDYLWAG